MHPLWLLLTVIHTVTALSATETLVLLDLVEYFQSEYLELLEESLQLRQTNYVSNASFPARKMVLTTVLSPQQLADGLGRKRPGRGGLPMVAAHSDGPAWSTFTQLAGLSTMRAAKWVLFTSSSSLSISTALKGLYVPFDCQFVVANMAGALPILTEVYQVAMEGPLQTNHFGYWDPEKGLFPPKTYFYTRRPDFKGHTFTAFIQNFPPYTYATKSSNGRLVLSGYFYEVWKELETRLKFRTEFLLADRKEKPKMLEARGEVSFWVSPVVQEPQVAKLVALTEPIYEAKIYLFGNRPGSELEWNSYLKPFSTETWLVTLGWMIVSAIAMYGLYMVAWRQQASEPEAGYYVFTLSVCLETVFRAMCAQGSDVTPRSLSCRLMFLSVYMTALVVTSAFSAALFSLLTVQVSKAPFQTFKDVYDTKSYKLGIIQESDIYEGIKDLAERYPDSDQGRLFRMFEYSGQLPLQVMEALEQVCMHKENIFMWDLPNVLEVMQGMNLTCQEKIMPGGPMIFKEHLGFAANQNSPYKELIDLQLVRLKNEGVLRRLLLNTWPPRIPNVQISWVRVTLADMSPILYMFGLGAVLGAAILLMERLHWRLRKGGSGGQTISRHIASATQLLHNLRYNFASSPVTPTNPWETKYTDWNRNDTTNNLHHRPRDKTHYQ